MIEEQLWLIYQHSYFRGICRHIPYHQVTNLAAGAIISVWNPHGQALSLAHNQRRQRAALRYLREHGINYKTLWGGNRDMSYREFSVFVPGSFHRAQTLSKHFSQLAFYYVNAKGRMSLHCSGQTMPICVVSQHIKTRWL